MWEGADGWNEGAVLLGERDGGCGRCEKGTYSQQAGSHFFCDTNCLRESGVRMIILRDQPTTFARSASTDSCGGRMGSPDADVDDGGALRGDYCASEGLTKRGGVNPPVYSQGIGPTGALYAVNVSG